MMGAYWVDVGHGELSANSETHLLTVAEFKNGWNWSVYDKNAQTYVKRGVSKSFGAAKLAAESAARSLGAKFSAEDVSKGAYTVFCKANGCIFRRENLGKREADIEATSHMRATGHDVGILTPKAVSANASMYSAWKKTQSGGQDQWLLYGPDESVATIQLDRYAKAFKWYVGNKHDQRKSGTEPDMDGAKRAAESAMASLGRQSEMFSKKKYASNWEANADGGASMLVGWSKGMFVRKPFLGETEWKWSLRSGSKKIKEGAASSMEDAKSAAESAAKSMGWQFSAGERAVKCGANSCFDTGFLQYGAVHAESPASRPPARYSAGMMSGYSVAANACKATGTREIMPGAKLVAIWKPYEAGVMRAMSGGVMLQVDSSDPPNVAWTVLDRGRTVASGTESTLAKGQEAAEKAAHVMGAKFAVAKYALTGPTRMDIQKAFDRYRSIGQTVRQASMSAEKEMHVSDIVVNSTGDVVSFKRTS